MAEFITDLFLVTNKDNDAGTFYLDTTMKGHDGNLYESSWRHKGKRLIGFKKSAEDEYVVTDIVVVTDDKDGPDDYAPIPITKDTREKGLKKHTVCYSRGHRQSSEKAITEIYLVNPSKNEAVPPYFTAVSETVNDITICFKTEAIPKIKRPAPSTPPKEQSQLLNTAPKVSVSSGIDGVPFQINPKFNTSSGGSDPLIANMLFVSPDDIQRKYQYSFDLEREVTR